MKKKNRPSAASSLLIVAVRNGREKGSLKFKIGPISWGRYMPKVCEGQNIQFAHHARIETSPEQIQGIRMTGLKSSNAISINAERVKLIPNFQNGV